MQCSKPASLLDHLVRSREQRHRYIEAKRRGSLEVDDQFEFGGELDRELTRFFASENTIHIGCGAAVKVGDVDAVRGQAAARDLGTIRVHGRHAVLRGKRSDQLTMNDCYRVSQDDQAAVRSAGESV